LIAQQKALAIREQVLEPDHPSIATSYNNLAQIYYHQENIKQAIFFLEKTYSIQRKKLKENHPSVKNTEIGLLILYNGRGQQLQAKKNYPAAIQDFQKALEFGADNAAIHNSIGLCYYYQKDYQQALQYYEKSHQLGFDNKLAHLNNTGMAYAKLGQLAEAKKRFEQLQKLVPDNGLVYRDWALYYALAGDVGQALDHLEKAVQLGYGNLEWVETEEALGGIRKEERYKKIIEQLRGKE